MPPIRIALNIYATTPPMKELQILLRLTGKTKAHHLALIIVLELRRLIIIIARHDVPRHVLTILTLNIIFRSYNHKWPCLLRCEEEPIIIM